MNLEQPMGKDEARLDIYLEGKSDEELASMADDPLDVLTTNDGSGEVKPTSGFEMDEIKQKAASKLESRRNSQ